MQKKFVQDWIINAMIEATKKKLKRAVSNNKREFEIQFKYIPKMIIIEFIGCYNGHIKKNKQFIIGWNKNKTCFDSRKVGAKCHEWVFDALLYNGDILIIINDVEKVIFRYYDCYTKYVGRLGTFTLGGKLMHKNKGTNSNWQK